MYILTTSAATTTTTTTTTIITNNIDYELRVWVSRASVWKNSRDGVPEISQR